MSFVSDLSKYNVITDENFDKFLDSRTRKANECSGYIPRNFSVDGLCSAPGATEFGEPLIPEDEIFERIEERERTKTRNVDLAESRGLKPKNQGYTNYCWANGLVYAAEFAILKETDQVVRLSSASVAGPATNFRNWRSRPVGIGGWSHQACQQMRDSGADLEEYWPANDPNPKYDTPESRERRKRNRVEEWYDLPPRSMRHLLSALLSNKPAPAGRMQWRHLTCDMDPVIVRPGEIGILTANSGLGRDKNGYTVLTGRMLSFDEATVPRVLTYR